MERTDVPRLPRKLAEAARESAGKSLCTLLTRDDAAKRIGKPVDAGKVAGPMGTACQWSSTDGESYLQIQAVPVDYWSAPR